MSRSPMKDRVAIDADEPNIGDAVELAFLDRSGVPIVAFRPRSSQ